MPDSVSAFFSQEELMDIEFRDLGEHKVIQVGGEVDLYNVSELKRDFETRTGRTVHKTTIYRLLERHGWRKVAPRTFHTKRNPAQTAALKKTPR